MLHSIKPQGNASKARRENPTSGQTGNCHLQNPFQKLKACLIVIGLPPGVGTQKNSLKTLLSMAKAQIDVRQAKAMVSANRWEFSTYQTNEHKDRDYNGLPARVRIAFPNPRWLSSR